jgi:hypothetical protein
MPLPPVNIITLNDFFNLKRNMNKLSWRLLLLLFVQEFTIATPLFCQPGISKDMTQSTAVITDTILPLNRALFLFPSSINSKVKTDTSTNMADYIAVKLGHIQVCSGEIYFSGAGFPSVQILLFVSCSQQGSYEIPSSLKALYARCRAGSEITFVQCRLKNKDGSISSPVNRTVRIL